jgi:predicted AAA+ superfamily ATPase
MAEVFPIEKAFIITRDQEQVISEKGLEIQVIPIWKWLLG